MEEALAMILAYIVPIFIAAILVYVMAWYIYKHIIKPDFDEFRKEQQDRHEELIEKLDKLDI